jgi:hypothetical protein
LGTKIHHFDGDTLCPNEPGEFPQEAFAISSGQPALGHCFNGGALLDHHDCSSQKDTPLEDCEKRMENVFRKKASRKPKLGGVDTIIQDPPGGTTLYNFGYQRMQK